jgi:hypothetical protein
MMRYALSGLLVCTLAACEGPKGESGTPGMSPSANDLAQALATNPEFARRVAAELSTYPEARGLPGPKGDQGETGETGMTGPAGETGPQGEPGADGEDAKHWKVCGVTEPRRIVDRVGPEVRHACGAGLSECSSARMCTVQELLFGAMTHDGDRTPNEGTRQTIYLRSVAERMIMDGTLDAENPYAFVHSGYWSTSCENYHADGGTTKEAFSDEFVDMTATVWPLIQLSVAQAGEALSTVVAVSARKAPCNNTVAPVICCDADGRPELNPPEF